MTDRVNPTFDLLPASGPAPELGPDAALYGRLIGSWDIENDYYDETAGQWRHSTPRWHFGWVLRGRGVQDVLVSERAIGTTVRVYDRDQKCWRVGWYGPFFADFATLTGSANGDDIWQDGTGTDGRPIRWNFSEITGTGFRWHGYVSDDGGTSWRLEQEMRARRS